MAKLEQAGRIFRTRLLSSSGLIGCAVLAAAGTASIAHAESLPSGGSVMAGSATITGTPTSTTVVQTSQNAVINWAGFSVDAGNSVNFQVPDAQGATLNRVTGNASSTIAGHITSNGSIYLVNPNGIAITESGSVQTGGGFVATTLDIADADFMAGRNQFSGKGASARVSNTGRISAGQGAMVALLGGAVSNSGTIIVPLGKLALASGEQIALDLNGGNFLQIAAPTSLITAANESLIDNSGAIIVDGGTVHLKADVVKDAVRNVINMSGSINADSAIGNGGTIMLIGGADTASMAGTVTVSGTLSARATGAAGDGGAIETSGEHIYLNGASVSTNSANGKNGTWLIDPVDFTVAASGGNITGAALSNALAAGNVEIASYGFTNLPYKGDITINDAVSWSANTLTMNSYRNIYVNAVMDVTNVARLKVIVGNINNTLFGDATKGKLLMGMGLDGFIGKVNLASTSTFWLNNTPHIIITTLGAEGSRNGTDLQGIQGYILGRQQVSWVLGADIDASDTANWVKGFAPLGSSYTLPFANNFNGLGHTISNLTIRTSDVEAPDKSLGRATGLFGFATTGSIIANVGLINASITGVGQVHAGALAGESSAIVDNVFSTGTVTSQETGGGLLGFSGSPITNSWSAATVTSKVAGGLVGYGSPTIVGSYATGNVKGVDVGGLPAYAGGLLGYNQVYADIKDSYATGNVTASVTATDGAVGGLVGYFRGTNGIKNSYATGAVTAPTGLKIGALVGSFSLGTLSNNFYRKDTPNSAAGITGVGDLADAAGTVTGLTTQQLKDATSFASWDIDNTGGQAKSWRIYDGYTMPLLKGFLTPVLLSAGGGSDLSVVYNGEAPTFSGGSYSATLSYTGTGANSALIGGGLTVKCATACINVGQYNVTIGGLYSSQQGYDLKSATTGGSKLTITARPVTVTADAKSSTYGAAIPELTYSFGAGDLLNGDTLSGALATTGTASASAGIYAITQGTLAAPNSNYALTFTGADLTIRPAALSATFTANAASGVYGETPTGLSGSFTATGLVNGDTLASLGPVVWTADGNSGVGTFGITGTLNNPNYSVTATQAAGNANAYTVTPRPITVTADAKSSIYGSSIPALTYTVGGLGLINGDTLGGALATTGTATSNAGIYAITQGTLANNKYTIIYKGADLTISPAALSVLFTANPISGVYGDTPTGLSGSITANGLVNGDTLASLGPIVWTADGAGAGNYAITGSLSNPNYSVTATQAAGNATAYSVTPRAITVAANAISVFYGSANPNLTYTVGGAGLVNGDTLIGALATTATAQSNIGVYSINQGTLAANKNYTITSFTGADLTVTARPITVTANALSSVYGSAIPALTYSVGGSGLVNGDALSGVLATTANALSGVGAYAITQGTLSAPSSNYALTFNGANLTIAARPITVTANAVSSIYGSAIPALTYTVGGLGLVNGDTLSGALATTGTSRSNVGTYGITLGTLGNSNYAISTFTGSNLTINPAALSMIFTANAVSGVYGEIPSGLGGSFSATGLVNGDTLASLGVASWTAGATTASRVGNYGISGSLSNPNYTIIATQAEGNASAYTVTPRTITVTANGQSGTYGSAIPALTYTVGGLGLVNGDSLGGALSTSGTASSNAGTYGITLGTLANPNYSISSFTGANLTINPAAISVFFTANASTGTYGSNPTGLSGTFTATGLVNGDTLANLGAANWTANSVYNSGVGSYAISGSLSNPNYIISATQAASNANAYTVTPKVLTLTPMAVTRIYNGQTGYTATASDLAGLSSQLGVSGDTVSSVTLTFDDKNVGTGKTLTASALSILSGTGDGAGNYTITLRPNTHSSITRLASVNWVGGPSGNWFDPSNWADGAVPDLDNVANVILPNGVNVTFGSGSVFPAIFGPVNIESLTGHGTAGLTQSAGTINIGSGGAILGNFVQTGGTANVRGDFTVNGTFGQGTGANGGSLTVQGTARISQLIGNLALGNLVAGGLVANSAGSITQHADTTLAINGESTLDAKDEITLTNRTNNFVGPVNAKGKAIALTNTNALTLGTVKTIGNLALISEKVVFGAKTSDSTIVGGNLTSTTHGNGAAGGATQGGAISVSGTTSFVADLGQDQDIVLTNSGNDFGGAIFITEANGGGWRNISLTDSNAMTIGTANASGNLTLNSTGPLNLGTSSVGGNLDVNSHGGNITQDGPLKVKGDSNIDAGAGQVNLTNLENKLEKFAIVKGSKIAIVGDIRQEAGSLQGRLGLVRANSLPVPGIGLANPDAEWELILTATQRQEEATSAPITYCAYDAFTRILTCDAKAR